MGNVEPGSLVRQTGFGEDEKSCGAAAEGSPRRQPWGWVVSQSSRAAAKENPLGPEFCPLTGLLAMAHFSPGSRRGPPASAAPWLTAGAPRVQWLIRAGFAGVGFER